jgi:hypothetical protein
MARELTTEDKKLIAKTVRVAKKVYCEKVDIAAFVGSSLRGNKKLIKAYVDKLLNEAEV